MKLVNVIIDTIIQCRIVLHNQRVHREFPLNFIQISEKQWQDLLVEEQVTMKITQGGSWRLAILYGLGPEHTSFLFRLLHCKQEMENMQVQGDDDPGRKTIHEEDKDPQWLEEIKLSKVERKSLMELEQRFYSKIY